MWFLRLLTYASRRTQLYITQSLDVVRFAYLTIYALSFGLGVTFGSPTILFIGFVLCFIYGTIFGARLLVMAGTYQTIRASLSFLPEISVNGIRYWTWFISMWASAPLLTMAYLKPWDVGMTWALVAAIFMILHLVATQRETGNFWRRVYAMATIAVVVLTVFAVTLPGTWARLTGGGHRQQEAAKIEEQHQTERYDALVAELKSINQSITSLEVEEVKAIAAGTNFTKDDELTRKRLAREKIQTSIDTTTSQAGQVGSGEGFSLSWFSDQDPIFWLFASGSLLIGLVLARLVNKTPRPH